MKTRWTTCTEHNKPSYRYCKHPYGRAAGMALIVAGLTLLFICIPGWAWAAAAGAIMIAVGYLLMCLN